MELVRYNHSAPLATVFDELNELFNAPYYWTGRTASGFTPNVDVYEEKDHFVVKAELPGIDKKNIDVKIENDVLTIAGEKQTENSKHEKGRFCYYERSSGKFSRSFKLPEHVDTASVEASYRDGVLEVSLKKRPEAQPRSIEVKVL